MPQLDKDFWSERYDNNSLGWDTGSITTPLKEYIDQLTDKKLKILIPGCGNGHEAVYLHEHGFNNVTVIDLVDEPIQQLREKCPNWLDSQFVVGNFFDMVGSFDLILEQTFFCAINPELRQNYADKVLSLLKPGGKLVGLLFNIPLGDGPPFGGDAEEYKPYFNEYQVNKLEPAHNSIKPRMGTELFINVEKPS